ncbi:hypothetical protein EHQ68_09350 [Leptospira congkakensis]|uniref:Uncharacterized protein n=1 Tax=Leptospira congkakensis TaxID=2484932 RepID=A0A4Z0ZY78_9LEPT|nr:hypothetical protein [Leptospira congkakensis]TGL85963.1 hypothetical protein EHQ69_17945 [Leptospira congkakensis]TGL88836.1 hypothetical protein EHQ68_09350 [Leptospira congkakensis]TGL93341.1 hypothetical protein EHQ70_17515 [Leptospira congkakensis]
MQPYFRIPFYLIILIFLTNCISFAEKLSEVDETFIKGLKQNPTTKSITIYPPSFIEHPGTVVADAKRIKLAFEESGYFKSVKLGNKEDEIFALVFYSRKPDGGNGPIISGATFGIIPAIGRDIISTEVTFRNNETGKAKSYTRVSEIKIYLGWIFLPLWPFFPETPQLNKIIQYQVNSILKEAKLDGVI